MTHDVVLVRFVVLGVLPFISIAFLNYKIYTVVRSAKK